MQPPRMVYPLTWRWTWREINDLLLADVYARVTGRRLLVDDRGWLGGRWSAWFDSSVARWTAFPRLRSVSGPGMAVRFTRLVNKLSGGSELLLPPDYFTEMRSHAFWKARLGVSEPGQVDAFLFREKAAVARRLYTFQPAVADALAHQAARWGLAGPYCAVHIRAHTGPLRAHADAVRETSLTNVVVCSDDGGAFEALKSALGAGYHLTFLSDAGASGHQEWTFRRSSRVERERAIMFLFGEVEVMRAASALVCTFSSNLSRFAALWVGLERCRSLQDGWHPF